MKTQSTRKTHSHAQAETTDSKPVNQVSLPAKIAEAHFDTESLRILAVDTRPPEPTPPASPKHHNPQTMKTDTTNDHSSHPHFNPNDDTTGDEGSPQHWINAKTMFRVREDPNTDYESWISSLANTLASFEPCDFDRPCRMLISSDGDHYLNLDFAAYLEENTRRDFFGGITMAVINDIVSGQITPMPKIQICSLISRLEDLEIDSFVDTDLLQELLEVDVDFHFWNTLLTEAFGMEYGRDVKAWKDGVLYEGTSLPDDHWKYKCYLSIEFATKVAMATPTFRGKFFHDFVNASQCATIQSETPGGDRVLDG